MEDEVYYIILLNRSYRREYNKDDYHLEKIFSSEQISNIIANEIGNYKLKQNSTETNNFLIITNDKERMIYLC